MMRVTGGASYERFASPGGLAESTPFSQSQPCEARAKRVSADAAGV